MAPCGGNTKKGPLELDSVMRGTFSTDRGTSRNIHLNTERARGNNLKSRRETPEKKNQREIYIQDVLGKVPYRGH